MTGRPPGEIAGDGKPSAGRRRLSGLATDWRDPQYLLKRPMFEHVRESRGYAKGKLLDVGCGNRPYLEVFRDDVSSYVGLDPDRRGSRPDVVGRANALPFADGSFDTVLSIAVIEHVPEPDRMLDEIHRVLCGGGHLILLAPQYWRLHEEPDDYFRFTRYGLEHLARSRGFALVDMRAQGGAWNVAGQAICGTLEHRPRLRRLIPLVNFCFSQLDRRKPDPKDTISYLMIARK